ncbi:S24/S26 family peptidase [Paenibacillus camelliae]|uniref:S24/S26 family peptidase n=1 Tax=Paenibacillus camelliae TaxID=512410 RepID=UPI00203FDC77|nr:S24/S26 family peptidase [Paenibacillus camelliae]MCM3633402.1 S24/S26 family peptidase [Paenibacillus camelliae]
MTLDRKLIKLDSEKLHPILQSTLEQQLDISLPVTGNSMQPLWMHNRDSVVLTPCDPYTLKKGDVVLYRRATGQIVLHRIVKVNEESYDLCGDAQVDIERGLPKRQVLAVMTSFTRNGRQYSNKQLSYVLYSVLWHLLRPARRAVRSGYRRWRRLTA